MLVTGPAGDETGRAGVPGGAVGILERATEGDGAWRWDESELTKRERRAVVAAKPPPVIAGECRSLGADVAGARNPHGRPRALPPATHRLRGARALVGAAFHRPARLHLHAARSPGVVAPLQGRRAPGPLLPPERLPLVPGRRSGGGSGAGERGPLNRVTPARGAPPSRRSVAGACKGRAAIPRASASPRSRRDDVTVCREREEPVRLEESVRERVALEGLPRLPASALRVGVVEPVDEMRRPRELVLRGADA